MRHKSNILLFLIITLAWIAPCYAQGPGKFVGKVVTEWLDEDGRKMKLIEPFLYVDPDGSEWNAPIGWVIDGASIPKVAWSVIGGPFEGKYRNASVIHDVACDQKTRPWVDVHRAFYNAMLTGGVDATKAKIMYAAVYHFGPRWIRTIKVSDVPDEKLKKTIENLRENAYSNESVMTKVSPIRRPGGCPEGYSCAYDPNPPISSNVTAEFIPSLPSISQDDFEKLKQYVETNNPSLPKIEDYGK